MFIYVLKLTDNKYYVGRTKNIKTRLEQHKNGEGSEWTKRYQFIELLEHFETQSSFDEDIYVKKYMNKYGIDNVRGGSYNQIRLSQYQKEFLIKELRTYNNLCYRCGRSSHYVNNCYAKTDIDGISIHDLNTSDESDSERSTEDYSENDFENVSNNEENIDIIDDLKSLTNSIYNYFKW